MKVALVCVARWEDYYLKEWLDYNQKLGFDKVIMYQNDWRTDLEHPILEKRISDGRAIQVGTYNHFLDNEREYDWVGFFDCDEYLVLKKHNNVKELIEEYSDKTNVIALNWIFYGNLGKLTREGDSLIKQFPMRSNRTDQHVKVFVNKRSSERMQLPHNTINPAMDTNGRIFQGPFNPAGPMDVAYINHYHNKTKEDWELRCKRGRVDCNLGHDYNVWDQEMNMNNEVEDLSAYNFLYGN